MTFNHQNDGSRRGEILAAGDLNGAPLVTDAMNLSGIQRMSFGWNFVQGVGTITRLDFVPEASYDGGQTWFSVTFNPDKQTPPDIGLADGLLQRTVAGDDTWCYEVGSTAFALCRLRVLIGAGLAGVGSLITVHAHGEP